MFNTEIKIIGSSFEQLTDGTQDYSVTISDGVARVVLSDSTPTDSTPTFLLQVNEGISYITHPGKVWVRSGAAEQPVELAINK